MKEWKGFCDLHVHTTNSDGKYTPYELVRLCMDKGIQTIAFTDHNVMLTKKEMNALREKFPEMHLIDGSEISAAHQLLSGKMKEIHILGLFLKPTDRLEKFLLQNKNRVEGETKTQIKEMIALLNGLGMNFTYENVAEMFPEKIIGRMELARFLTEKGMVRTEEEAFDTYIGDSGEKRAYVERSVHCASMKKVIAEILEADGVPVLAHVFNYSFPPHERNYERNYLIKTFVQEGGLAIEAFYSPYMEALQQYLYLFCARKRGLGVSAGSDFHGFFEHDSLECRYPAAIACLLGQMAREKRGIVWDDDREGE